jgi:hypothetical protein
VAEGLRPADVETAARVLARVLGRVRVAHRPPPPGALLAPNGNEAPR